MASISGNKKGDFMRLYSFVLFAVFALNGFAQPPVSNGNDMEIQNIMSKIEGGTKKPGKLINEVPAETEHEKEISKAIERYWQALLDNDYTTSYQMMCDDYRNVVSLQGYLQKKRIGMDEVRISSILYDGKACAQSRGIFSGESGSMLGRVKIPLRATFLKENGEWRVFENPYNVMGIVHPQGKKIIAPCEFKIEKDPSKGEKE